MRRINFDIPVTADMKPNPPPESPALKAILQVALVVLVLSTARLIVVLIGDYGNWPVWTWLFISAVILSSIGLGIKISDILPDSATPIFVSGLMMQLLFCLGSIIYLIGQFLFQPPKSPNATPVNILFILAPLIFLLGTLIFIGLIKKYCMHELPDKHAAVITMLGLGNRKRVSLHKLVFVWPFFEQLEKYDLRPKTQLLEVECATFDRITVTFQATVVWQEDTKRLLYIVQNNIKGADLIKSKLQPAITQEANTHVLDKLMAEPKFMQTQMLRLISHQLAHEPQKPGINIQSIQIVIKLSELLTDLYEARKQMQIQEELATSSGKQEAQKLREIDQIAARSSSKTLEHLENMKNAESGMLNRK
jgi:regulator of protease activity HflC (stomatin/prohibitin superfamily)